jgi:hypothetical protein
MGEVHGLRELPILDTTTRERRSLIDVLRPPKLGEAKYAGETYRVILRCGYNGTENVARQKLALELGT